MNKTINRFFLRLTVSAVFAAALLGPAPGEIGGCGLKAGVADPVKFCEQRIVVVAERELKAQRIEMAERDRRVQRVSAGACRNSLWPKGCKPPDQERANACINALTNNSESALRIPSSDISECKESFLCMPSDV